MGRVEPMDWTIFFITIINKFIKKKKKKKNKKTQKISINVTP